MTDLRSDGVVAPRSGRQAHAGKQDGEVGGTPTERVLVVGSNHQHLGTQVEQVVRAGYTAMQTGNPADALRMAREYQPVAVLLQGGSLARVVGQGLRADHRTCQIPVLMDHELTGFGSNQSVPTVVALASALTTAGQSPRMRRSATRAS